MPSWDAALSAFAALQALTGRWTNDLLELELGGKERCIAPCEDTHYYWPE